jgi:hypothetical protein
MVEPVAAAGGGAAVFPGWHGLLRRLPTAGGEHLQNQTEAMIIFLRIAYVAVLIAMAWVTIWASDSIALWNTPSAILTHPWFIATLFDTYFAFLIFFAWVAYKETRVFARVAWLIAILALGNFAIATYMLIQLFRVPADAPIEALLLRKKTARAP